MDAGRATESTRALSQKKNEHPHCQGLGSALAKSLDSLAFAVASGLLLGACAHPFLAAGGKYAAGVEKGNATLSTLMDSEAQVFRRRTALAKASPAFKVKSADDLNSALRNRAAAAWSLVSNFGLVPQE